jgi:hypothetical protein
MWTSVDLNRFGGAMGHYGLAGSLNRPSNLCTQNLFLKVASCSTR